LFADRRASDYLAERLVRVYVGIENGPFLIYRRRQTGGLAERGFAKKPALRPDRPLFD
jgi:hypothetical protein